MQLWVILLQLVCIWGLATGNQVYLRKISIYKYHDPNIPFMKRKPDVYLSCQGSGDKIKLGKVKETKEVYEYEVEEKPVTSFEKGECKKCSLMEGDKISSDDKFGDMELCEEDFRETGELEREKKDEFNALFECKACIPPPPPPPPPPPRIIRVPVAEPAREEAYTYSHAEAKVVTDVEDREVRKKHVWNSPLFILLLIVLTLSGLIFGGVSYRWYLNIRERAEEEKMREFEAILGDPDVDFEDMVDQDQRAFNLNFWRHIHWHPRRWMKVGVEDDDDKPVVPK